ncbi:MAG: PilZ domain-containing protein [Chitinivibrionia bacterium]|nr:PilZ domain-containing protein [Chitinivibrionia bacterium]
MQNNFLPKFTAIVFAILSFAVAQTRPNNHSVAQRFEWHGPSEEIIIGVLIAVAAALSALIIASIVQQKEKKKTISDFVGSQFEQRARNAGLSASEQTLLRNMTKAVAPDMLADVFSSLMIFENAVDVEINKVIRHYRDDTPKALAIADEISFIRKRLGFTYIEEKALESTRNIEFGQEILLYKPYNDVFVGQTRLLSNNELYFEVDLSLLDNYRKDRSESTLVAKITRKQDAIYTIPLTIRSTSINHNTLSFYHTTTLERQQARQYARLPVDILIHCKIIKRADEKAKPGIGEILQDAALIDISGGGLAFNAPASLSPQDIVFLEFTLNQQKFAMKGKIIAISSHESKQNVYYKHRLIFFNPLESDIERIVKFIYEKQREKIQFR